MRNALLTMLFLGGAAIATAAPQDDRGLTNPGAGRRLAVVVGNDAYAAAPLKNAVADARAVSTALQSRGFDVTLIENAGRAALVRGVAQIGDRIRPDDVVLFFFAGHGVQLGGENYLIPVDFVEDSATAVRLSSLSVTDVQESLSKAKVALIVLDACRNNPFTGQRGSAGLAGVEARGTLIAFATGAGQTASDNSAAGNGLFTQEFLRALQEPNVTARDLFYRVRQRVYEASNGQQFPAVYDGLLGDITFAGGHASTAAVAGGAPENKRPEPPRPNATLAGAGSRIEDARRARAEHQEKWQAEFVDRNGKRNPDVTVGVGIAAEGAAPVLTFFWSDKDDRGKRYTATVALVSRSGEMALRFRVQHIHPRACFGVLHISLTRVAYEPSSPQFKDEAFDVRRDTLQRLGVHSPDHFKIQTTQRGYNFFFPFQESGGKTSWFLKGPLRRWAETALLDFDAARREFERATADSVVQKAPETVSSSPAVTGYFLEK